MAFTYEILNKTAAAWAADTTTIPKSGQETLESDTGLRKLGDGVTTNHSLPYLGGGGNVTGQSSSVDGEAALFSGTTGKVIKRSTLTGILKGTSGVTSAATSGTDYAPGTSALATGIVKSTTSTGALSIAASGTDYAPATSGTSSLKGNGSGGFSAATLNDNGAPTADYSMNSHKITNQADPTAAQDSATKNYVDTRQFTANMGATTASVTNTTTDTTLWTPANVAATSLVGGTTCFRIRFGGNFDNAATSGAFTARIKINGTTVASVPVAISQTGAATLTAWWADVDVYIDVTGSTGSVTAQGYGVEITAAGGARNTIPVLATTTLLNMTAGVQFTLTGQMGTANASNVLRIWRAVINQIA